MESQTTDKAAFDALIEGARQVIWKLGHNHDDDKGGSKPGTVTREDATVKMLAVALCQARCDHEVDDATYEDDDPGTYGTYCGKCVICGADVEKADYHPQRDQTSGAKWELSNPSKEVAA